MKWIKTTGRVAIVFSMLALGAGAAEAQFAPTLTATASGSTVTIQWTPIAGATGYTIQAGTSPTSANIASVNLPATITRVVVNAPDGTYYLAVRAFAGNIVGPFSNIVNVTVGAAACSTQPAAPVVTPTVTGPSVTLNWAPVANALGYRVQISRSPGTTELERDMTAATTSFTQYIPMLGTFYARVVAGNLCGLTPSAEVSFSITSLAGAGPRTPDPAPGQMLPLPGYGHSVALLVAQQYPGDLARACSSRTYLYRLLYALRKRDSRWGLNYKRGWTGSLSTDIITYNGTDEPDNGADHIYLVDVVSSICEANRFSWNWQETTYKTWDAAGSSACGTHWCAKWTIDPYLAAGFPPY
jgi:hypothetical protein